jgi:glycine oxidase
MLIVGGGIFGLAIGWYLARAGSRVTVLEQGRVGGGASWAAAGMLMPWKLSATFSDHLFAMQRVSHGLWPAFVKQLAPFSEKRLDYHTGGRFFVAMSGKVAKRLKKQFDYHHDVGLPVKWLSGVEVRTRAPYLGPMVEAAIFSPMGHAVDNRQIVQGLRRAFLQAGGRLLEHTSVQEVLISDQVVRGVRLSTTTIAADTVIIATGAWTAQLAGLSPAMQRASKPRKGQTLTLQMSVTSPLVDRTVIGPVYLVPRRDGRLIVGTTVEREAGYDTRNTVDGVYHILNKARRMVPGVEQLPLLEMGAGLRPTGPDRLPVLGPTDVRGLILATGAHSSGILLTPVVARAVAKFVNEGQIDPIIDPFLPARRLSILAS